MLAITLHHIETRNIFKHIFSGPQILTQFEHRYFGAQQSKSDLAFLYFSNQNMLFCMLDHLQMSEKLP